MSDRRPLAWMPSDGLPAGARIRYECLLCTGTVASMPARPEACRCGNVFVDVDAGRVRVQAAEQMSAYEEPA